MAKSGFFRKRFIIFLAIITIIFGLFVLFMFFPWSFFSRFYFVPAPAPYSDIKLEPEYTTTACDYIREDSRFYRYEINRSLTELQKYYDEQMARYCVDKSSWTDLLNSQATSCSLPNQQFFRVDLIPKSPNRVEVLQSQHMTTKVNDSPKFCGE